jgi:predicted transcriptional regulator
MKRNFIVFSGSLLITLAGFIAVNALSVNQDAPNLNIRDANDQPASIPDFGSKILTVVYGDSDASDISDPISDALKAKNFPKSKNIGIGIANLKDSPAPNWLIRKIVRRKIEKYQATILTDVDLTVARTWGLGDCNNKSVFIIIGKDKKVKFIKYFDKYHPPVQSDIDYIVNLVDGLVKK